tara:strand:+ start:620 stop:1432 length:813 start_codon:yes stop_codon:yes gene_type:complete
MDILAELFDHDEETHSQEEVNASEPLENLDLDDDNGLDSPDNQDSKTNETEKPENKAKEGEPELNPKWDEEKANLEKRVNDNRASYQREHQARLDAEKRIEALEAKQKEDNDDDWLDDDSGDSKSNSEIESLNKTVKELQERDAERERVAASEKWELASKPFRDKHDDFDKYVDAVADVYETNADVQAQFDSMGRTPEAAYKLGKKLEQQEMMKDPEKYKAYLLEELKNQQAEKPGTSKKLDSLGEIDTNSTPPDEGYKDDVDVMDELFG